MHKERIMTMHAQFRARGLWAAALLLGGAAAIGITAHAPKAQARDWDRFEERDADHYTVGLFGDMPYGTLGLQQYPNVLDSLNASDIRFSIFDGDMKAGDGVCTDGDLYLPRLADFNSLHKPLFWVPGDNDWTDCWRYSSPDDPAASDPIDRLNHERQLFCSTPFSLGEHKYPLARQSYEGGQNSLYSENIRWKYGPVVYIGLNVQGSNDNYPSDSDSRGATEIARERAEEVPRKAADLAWLHESFDFAKSVHAAGVLIVIQADPHFTTNNSIFTDYINAWKAESLAFSGQVILVHGDSHYFVIDKPIDTDQGGVLANFTRVETFGSRNLHWVKATIDVRNPNVFSFEPQMVPGNIAQP